MWPPTPCFTQVTAFIQISPREAVARSSLVADFPVSNSDISKSFLPSQILNLFLNPQKKNLLFTDHITFFFLTCIHSPFLLFLENMFPHFSKLDSSIRASPLETDRHTDTHCVRQDGAARKASHPNLRNMWICCFMWWRRLCRCDPLKGPEIERLSTITGWFPCNHKDP